MEFSKEGDEFKILETDFWYNYHGHGWFTINDQP